MDVNVGDLLTVNGEKYITLEILNYENGDYAFVNKVTLDEEMTDEFYIFEVLGNSVKIVKDDKLKEALLPKFEKMLNEDIKKLAEV